MLSKMLDVPGGEILAPHISKSRLASDQLTVITVCRAKNSWNEVGIGMGMEKHFLLWSRCSGALFEDGNIPDERTFQRQFIYQIRIMGELRVGTISLSKTFGGFI